MDDLLESSELTFSCSSYSLIPEISDTSLDEKQKIINYEAGVSKMDEIFCPIVGQEVPPVDSEPDPDTIKMFVGQIPQNYTENDLLELFARFGKVYELRILKNKITGRSKGCCFVTFFSRRSALEAQNALHNIQVLPGMHHPIQMKPADSQNRNDRKLFIGMLSKELDESDVRSLFSPYGPIEECTVLRDSAGKSKGCAFVTYLTRRSAHNAIKSMHHCHIFRGCSSPLVVKFADTQKDKEQRRMCVLQNDLSFQNTLSAILQKLGGDGVNSLISSDNWNFLQKFQNRWYNNANCQFPTSNCQDLSNIPPSHWRSAVVNSTNLQTLLGHCFLNQTANDANDTPVMITDNSNNFLIPLDSCDTCNIQCPPQSNTENMALTTSSTEYKMYNWCLQRLSADQKQIDGPEGANLFIYHLPPEFTDQNLVELFDPYGPVISAKVFVDKVTKTSKCFGFVSYDNVQSAKTAINRMNGYQVLGKKLKVEVKKKRKSNN